MRKLTPTEELLLTRLRFGPLKATDSEGICNLDSLKIFIHKLRRADYPILTLRAKTHQMSGSGLGYYVLLQEEEGQNLEFTPSMDQRSKHVHLPLESHRAMREEVRAARESFVQMLSEQQKALESIAAAARP